MSTKSISTILSQCKTSGKTGLRITFPNSTVTSPGTLVPRSDAKPPPTISISSDIAAVNPTGQYLLICLDLDAPYPSFPFLSPILHFIQINLIADSQSDAAGFFKLTSDEGTLCPWTPPNPPPLSTEHRYVFILWKHPEGLTKDSVKQILGLSERMTLLSRVRWDQEGCENKLGLEHVLGGTYFMAK